MDTWTNRVHFGDCLETLRRMPDGIVQTCVTSPPYFGLRDYGHAGQIGLEETPEEFIDKLVDVFREVRRVLRDDGTAWINIGDSYARNAAKGGSGPGGKNIAYSDSYTEAGGAGIPQGLKEKDLIGVPWMLAFALRADGWYLRSEIIWRKTNGMPESVTDRPTRSHEHLFLLAKRSDYYCDMEAIKEPVAPATVDRMAQDVDSQQGSMRANGGGDERPMRAGGRSRRDSFKREDSKRAEVIPGQSVGTHRDDREESEYDTSMRNKRSVWDVATKPYKGAHFAVYPEELIEPCILAGSPPGGIVLDPFMGSGTTGSVAQRLGRQWIGLELNPAYAPLQDERLTGTLGMAF